MRFSKVFITTKPDGMNDDIRKDVERLLDGLGIDHTNQPEPHTNLMITIGGDGTLLRNQNNVKCPILGINGGGSVGHYLSAGPDDYQEKIKRIVEGTEGKDYTVRRLMRLFASINDEPIKEMALNEFIISPTYVRRMLKSEITVNEETSLEMNTAILTYTPTGSTGFANSAGAKAIGWDNEVFGICAVAPYKGVLKDGERKTTSPATIIPMNSESEICVDGQDNQTYGVLEGDIITIKKSESPARLIWFDKASNNDGKDIEIIFQS